MKLSNESTVYWTAGAVKSPQDKEGRMIVLTREIIELLKMIDEQRDPNLAMQAVFILLREWKALPLQDEEASFALVRAFYKSYQTTQSDCHLHQA